MDDSPGAWCNGFEEFTMPPSATLLAVDLGAGSGRLLAGRLASGFLVVTEIHRFTSPPRTNGGLLRWDVDDLEASIRRGLALIGSENVVSLGIDTWGVDFVLVGGDGFPVEAPRCYRNEHTREVLTPTLSLLGEKELYARTGIQTQHFNTLFQLAAWQQSSPETFARGRRFAMIPDWLIHRLGAPLVNERTNASTTQLLDARTRDWDRTSLSALRFPPHWFEVPVAPGSVLAESSRLGAHRPALVAPATHDTGSAVAAIPLTGGRSAYICTGTWCLIGVESDSVETGEAARRANFTNEAGVDGTYRFLKNCMGLWLLQQLRASWPECPEFGPLVRLADQAEPLAALVDADDPVFFQPASMKEALEAWWTSTGQPVPQGPGGYARACIDSLVLVFRKTLEEIQDIRGVKLETLHMVGGGCRNELLCQLTADATGLTVLAGPVEGSALGNLLVQARALGLVAGQKEARSLVERSFPLVEYRPRGDREAWNRAARRLEDYRLRSTSAS